MGTHSRVTDDECEAFVTVPPHSGPQMVGVIMTVVIDRDMKLVLGLRGPVKALP